MHSSLVDVCSVLRTLERKYGSLQKAGHAATSHRKQLTWSTAPSQLSLQLHYSHLPYICSQPHLQKGCNCLTEVRLILLSIYLVILSFLVGHMSLAPSFVDNNLAPEFPSLHLHLLANPSAATAH